ncbi:MAG: SDR family oxidoreductase [Oscillatoria sp. PMC 1068.18]|nr:SDR family oxidoreductase [Oscillatoria sp. PMC 1076.18]MEC4990203.1 SDR family oxidoreductase [Oscillatoria sp. PMC 1068.18]
MQDKVVVVVGATGGIGSVVSEKLASAGANLVLASRNREKLSVLASQFSNSAEIVSIPTDITDPQQVETLIAKTVDRFGRIDVLVNAAGAGVMKQFNRIEPADLERMLDLNLKGCFYTTQAAAKAMRESKSGHICNLVGILGKHPMAMASAYCAAKYGVVGFSKCMAEELKRFGIKITLFYFGGVDTPFWDRVSLKVDRKKMLSGETAANAIMFALNSEPQAVPMEINIQPESHLFL